MSAEWPGQRELQGALQQLIAHKELPAASTVNHVASVALQHAKVRWRRKARLAREIRLDVRC